MNLTFQFWRVREVLRLIWVRIAAISALAVVAAIIAPFVSQLLPEGLKDRIPEKAVTDLLSVIAGSMLAVATFSLSVMVSAHHYAASQVTPRSHRLLRQDGRTQSVLATFIGAFVYALVAIIILNAGFYQGRDYLVIFSVTILVIAFVIFALVRWVQHISDLGSIEATTRRVEAAALKAMQTRMDHPYMGARPLDAAIRTGEAIPVIAGTFGWVQHVDLPALSELAEKLNAKVHLNVMPGHRVDRGLPLMEVEVLRLSTEDMADLTGTIVVGDTRSFDQDPSFGLEVMSEIAQRALSPGLNDPRTATDIIWRQHGILDLWREVGDPENPAYPRLHVPGMTADHLTRVALDHIARDGAALVEVQVALQSALAQLADHREASLRDASLEVSARALARSEALLPLTQDRVRVRDIAPARKPADFRTAGQQ
ncbi:DUF2254 domain-containing protein [Jannaschia sp. 2305UL9-9]|uniref:DUF2254 domain-containing protein n=1 Tax=Jannaschia sp. 2305UL9-9 TaxID=3121638 RepID=UPI00352846E4